MWVLEVKDLGDVTKLFGIGMTYDNKNLYYLKKAQSIRETLPEIHLEQAYSSHALIGE